MSRTGCTNDGIRRPKMKKSEPIEIPVPRKRKTKRKEPETPPTPPFFWDMKDDLSDGEDESVKAPRITQEPVVVEAPRTKREPEQTESSWVTPMRQIVGEREGLLVEEIDTWTPEVHVEKPKEAVLELEDPFKDTPWISPLRLRTGDWEDELL